jgi:hypothetical protein
MSVVKAIESVSPRRLPLFALEENIMKALPFLLLSVIAVSCLASAASSLPALKAERWVNSAPLTAETLQGKVVLIDFWEYTCVNWIRTAPYVKRGIVITGRSV